MSTDRLADATALVDNMCRLTVWWTHNRAKFTTPRQAAFAAWNEAFRAAMASPWQPIATAPKDGSEVLLLFPEAALVLGKHYGRVRAASWCGGWSIPYLSHNPPSHWAPLSFAPVPQA